MTPFSVALERGDYELAALRLLLGLVRTLARLQACGEAAAATRDELLSLMAGDE